VLFPASDCCLANWLVGLFARRGKVFVDAASFGDTSVLWRKGGRFHPLSSWPKLRATFFPQVFVGEVKPTIQSSFEQVVLPSLGSLPSFFSPGVSPGIQQLFSLPLHFFFFAVF